MQLVCKSGEIGVQLQCFWNTIAMNFGHNKLFQEKQGDNTKKGNKGLKLLKTIFRSFYEIEQGEEIKKNKSKYRHFFRSNGVCILL